ncbi:4318_t:CDS:2 [Rhizophagus irregularis]|nr:4318_t:CDS:2 [Rhizophagus irregularis]
MSLDNFRRSNAPVNRVNINGVSNRRQNQNNQNNRRLFNGSSFR